MCGSQFSGNTANAYFLTLYSDDVAKTDHIIHTMVKNSIHCQ